MTRKHSFIRLLLPLILVVLTIELSPAQVVISNAAAGKSLSEQWTGAHTEAKKKGFTKGYWIGYSIERLMGERSFVGSFYSNPRRNKPTLGELITGVKENGSPNIHSSVGMTSMDGVMTFDDDKKPERKIVKEMGILFHFSRTDEKESGELKVSNLSLHVDLQDDPLIWLGPADHSESISFLESLFKNSGSMEIKKHLIMAIGLHDESKSAIAFLHNVLLSSEHSDVREEAAFWLGQTNTDDARKILLETAENDRSEDVREKAIFSISQMEGEASTDALITLAKTNHNGETRKKAAFWLGQKASEKAVGTLKELAYNDEDTEVQKSALFALTQLDHGKGVEELIKIARTHANPKVRKEAIFWLGQCEDPKAIDALIEIIKK